MKCIKKKRCKKEIRITLIIQRRMKAKSEGGKGVCTVKAKKVRVMINRVTKEKQQAERKRGCSGKLKLLLKNRNKGRT